jgi:hypothetical protein
LLNRTAAGADARYMNKLMLALQVAGVIAAVCVISWSMGLLGSWVEARAKPASRRDKILCVCVIAVILSASIVAAFLKP